MAVFDIILLQITNKPNLTLPYLTNLASHALTLPGASFPSSFPDKYLYSLHLMPDEFFKKLGKINFVTAIVHKCS